jgi:Ner family transcriptional regulator
MQKDPNNSWMWLKHHLELRGLTFGKIGKIHKIHKSCFTKVKTVPMPKNERILSDYVGIDPWDIWPDRYDAAHNPNRISPRYQGHKHFLHDTQNKLKSNGKDNPEIKPLKPTPGAAE